MEDKKSSSVIIIFPGQKTPMQLWELPEILGLSSDFLFQTILMVYSDGG